MKLLFYAIIVATPLSLWASPPEILCINTYNHGQYREIRFVKTNGNKYQTTLTLKPDKSEVQESLKPSRLHVLRQKKININSLDLVVEFDIVTANAPTKPARIQLMKYNMNATNWLCKGYFYLN